jgi:hypothetical protein
MEHDAWWAPRERGYTRQLLFAGVYSEADAKRCASNPENEEAMTLKVAVIVEMAPLECSVLEHFICDAEDVQSRDQWKDRARHAELECDALTAKVLDLEARVAEDNEVCLCGCADHEQYGEDGESCGSEGHECLRVCPAVAALFAEMRDRLTAKARGLEAAPWPSGTGECGHNKYWTKHYGGCMACDRDTASAEADELRGKLATLLVQAQGAAAGLQELRRGAMEDKARAEKAEADLKRRDEHLEGHPAMCCGKCVGDNARLAVMVRELEGRLRYVVEEVRDASIGGPGYMSLIRAVESAERNLAAAADPLPCVHGRPSWRMCPHCSGINASTKTPPGETA